MASDQGKLLAAFRDAQNAMDQAVKKCDDVLGQYDELKRATLDAASAFAKMEQRMAGHRSRRKGRSNLETRALIVLACYNRIKAEKQKARFVASNAGEEMKVASEIEEAARDEYVRLKAKQKLAKLHTTLLGD
jgi:uncharacterized protein YukE